MAESFLFNIAENVLMKLGSNFLQEFFLVWGLEGERETLEEILSAVKVVLLDAEQQQGQNHRIHFWLGKLKDVLYDAEDVLDEFECEALRMQVVKRGSIVGKVRRFLSSSNPLAFRCRVGYKIRKISDRVVKIAAGKSNFNLAERDHDSHVTNEVREMTHSFVDAADVIGREEDKEKIIKLLMQSVDGENISVIPIVGIGGLGKTTLAQLAYNDERIDIQFELKIWICVSVDFYVKKLMIKIIKSATNSSRFGDNYINLEMDELQRILRETLDGRKYLLVLDDVWNNDPRKWDELKTFLVRGAYGSKIVVTTRSSQVASIMGTIPAYNLTDLPHQHCLSLFLKCTFREGQEQQYPQLIEMGEEIVRKCKGVPLAVMTLGTLLYSTTDEHDWKRVRDSDIWKLDQKENDIIPVLRLSYEQLPSHLKRCFAYCSIFPKDYIFDDIELVEFWLAQGLLQTSTENQELEDVGIRYLKELQSRCFFQDFQVIYGSVTFKIHDLMHDLALSVAKTECSLVTSSNQQIPKSVRHLSFPEPESLSQDLPKFLDILDQVRTVSFVNEREGFCNKSAIEIFFSRSQYLRALDLTNSQFEVLPRTIGTLKHLRYLNLAWNRQIKRLPSSICKLQNLQTLIMVGCDKIEELPRDIRCMISLRFLWITTKQKCLPRGGIGCLKGLRFLYIVDCENLEYLFEDMQGLKSLRRLFICSCGSLISLPQSMKYLTALETLVIFDCQNLSWTMERGEDNQDFSQFNLKKLVLASLQNLVDFPQWLLRGSANSLQWLKIENCIKLKELPDYLQNLASLQELWIEGCVELTERCRRGVGADWPKIAHIPRIHLDGVNINQQTK